MAHTSVSLPFRQVQSQIDIITGRVHGARRQEASIFAEAKEVDDRLLKREHNAHAGIAVMNQCLFRQPASLMVALEVWEAISGWQLHTKLVDLKKRELGKFDQDQFSQTERTSNAFSTLSKLQKNGAVYIIPVRAEILTSFEFASEEEFDLDLTSVIWYMCTHWHKILRMENPNFQIACLGERFNNTLVPIVSIHNGERAIQLRHEDEVIGMHRIVGILPQ